MAESVFVHMVNEAGLQDRFHIESAGTGDWHVGGMPDPRTVAELRRHGIDWASRVRQVRSTDFQSFDYILAMDRANVRDLLNWQGADPSRVSLLLEWDPEAMTQEVPDPYYGNARDFSDVYDLVRPACEQFLKSALETVP